MSNAKVIRGQLRQIVKEELENVMLAELRVAISKDVFVEVTKRLTALEDMVREKLTVIDERSKDVTGYLVRQVSKPSEIKE